MPTPTIPSTGPVDMGSIRNAFPGLSNPPNLAEFIGMHPSLPATAGSSISFGQFHGLTAVSPTFTFTSATLSNGVVALSNGVVSVTGSVSSTNPLSGSFALSNYLNLVSYNVPITFALSNGSSLPTGVSMESSGILAHTLTSSVTSTANVIATNRWGNIAYIPLSYNVGSSVLFPFTSFTFTNAGATGINGPTLAQLQTNYNTSWSTTNLNMIVQGVQQLIVPETRSYTFIVAGAQGGHLIPTLSSLSGNGNIVKGTFALNSMDVLYIIVGQKGLDGANQTGGGGGTYIFRNTLSLSNLVFAAGGGGGVVQKGTNGINGNSGPNGTDGGNGTISFTARGGTAGGGGNGGYDSSATDLSGKGSSFGDGGNANTNSSAGGGAGGGGLSNVSASSTFKGGLTGNNGTNGGFGGGGASGASSLTVGAGGGCGGGGGGGGYSGGAGGHGGDYYFVCAGYGGGGGSYVSPSAISVNLSYGTNPSNGYVILS